MAKTKLTKAPKSKPQEETLSLAVKRVVADLERLPETDRRSAFGELLRAAVEIPGIKPELEPKALAPQRPKLSEGDLKQIGADISRVSGLIHSILGLAMQIEQEDVAGIEALCEKAGAMSDRCAEALGDIPVCGSYEEWANLKWPDDGTTEEEQEAEAQEAHHG